MVETKTMITYAGLKKYEDELRELKLVKRQEVAEKIKVAREQGDLSENADYDAAKDEQSEIERRILEIERILKSAEVVFDEDIEKGKVNVGCSVKLLDSEFNEKVEYQIVGSSETHILMNRISNESPIGAALMGHKAGEKVKIQLPNGEKITYKILEVKKLEA